MKAPNIKRFEQVWLKASCFYVEGQVAVVTFAPDVEISDEYTIFCWNECGALLGNGREKELCIPWHRVLSVEITVKEDPHA